MTPASRAKSFTYATNGIYQLLRQEPNAKLHAAATLVAVTAGAVQHLGAWRWAALLMAIALVWITEAINTCIEKLCDHVCDNKFHPTIKIIKDIAAAAVLFSALAAVGIGIVIFIL